jgi:two-component system OmpR family sensor kinase
MLNTLYRKLTVLLIGFTGLITLIFTYVIGISHDRYHQELVQKLNEPLARQLLEEGGLDPASAPGGMAAVESRLRDLTRVNPNIDLYLLDGTGRIVATSVAADSIAQPRVRLDPLLRFVGGSKDFPLRGDDPTGNAKAAVFSAAPLPGAGPASYLYAVLHDTDHAVNVGHRSVAQDLRQSYAQREAVLLTASGVVLSLFAGLALLKLLTRPLQQLSRAMERFHASNFTESPQVPVLAGHADDEVACIGRTFDRMAARIREQMDALRRADAELRDTFACISHDLRTPLASVEGYLETLLLKYDCLNDAERKRYAEIAAQQTERLAALVNALFDLAKLESREARLNVERFNVADLAQDVVQKFDLAASRKGIELVADTSGRLPLVAGDLTLVERVLDNLIENALRHTASGGRIVISAVPEDGDVRVSVADTGSGIAPEDLPHVFDRFYRGKNTVAQCREGAGLGLAFVKRVIELHGSTVSATSTVGAGTRFAFRLPTSTPAPRPRG